MGLMLDAVDNGGGKYPADINVLRFRLDGVVYVVSEDPQDGYRSSMDTIEIQATSDITNVFPPHEVYAHMNEHEGSEILELVDAKTGLVVLRAGTDHSDDYYPHFVAYWNPEGLWINSGVLSDDLVGKV